VSEPIKPTLIVVQPTAKGLAEREPPTPWCPHITRPWSDRSARCALGTAPPIAHGPLGSWSSSGAPGTRMRGSTRSDSPTDWPPRRSANRGQALRLDDRRL